MGFFILFFLLIKLFFCVKQKSDLKENYRVKQFPYVSKTNFIKQFPKMYSGHLKLHSKNNTFYFFFKIENKSINYKTTFWFNGGPGCSSMDGLFLGSGPFIFDSNGKLINNKFSVHDFSNVVFVDQPSNTGFSYSDEYHSDLDQIGTIFVKFLKHYFEIFPEEKNNEIYLAGESYAGQYIPYIAKAILDRNDNSLVKENKYNLKALIIGNGWIHPKIQSLSFLDYSIKKKILKKSYPGRNDIMNLFATCKSNMKNIYDTYRDDLNSIQKQTKPCDLGFEKLLAINNMNNKTNYCTNMYLYKIESSIPFCGMEWPFELTYLKKFLSTDRFLNFLNLKKKINWIECNPQTKQKFTQKKSYSSFNLLPNLLKKLIIVIHVGDDDMVCNYIGLEKTLDFLTWNGQKGFSNNNTYTNWQINNENVGLLKYKSNLMFLRVYNASHMTFYDNPKIFRAIFNLLDGFYEKKIIKSKDINEITINTYMNSNSKKKNSDFVFNNQFSNINNILNNTNSKNYSGSLVFLVFIIIIFFCFKYCNFTSLFLTIKNNVFSLLNSIKNHYKNLKSSFFKFYTKDFDYMELQ